MKLINGLYIEEAGAVKVIYTNKSILLPEGENLTVFLELTPRDSAMTLNLPKPENSAFHYLMIMLKANTEDTDVTIKGDYVYDTSADFTLDEPLDYMLFFSDGQYWFVLNYNYS